ncbi:GNAT family N-acetyltransferase [Nocardioides aequoreus]|uniref:GNAT family N-acetyltransferase n=1 Tax=Nocardioides aequoreus TaxID=397278 RepID=UPI00068FD6F5|nr:GNAT family N-acetyltransferase [Nocardioides aequoreus]
MTRRTERLTLDHLPLLPAGSDCVFWELDPVRRREVRGHEAEEKAAWVSTVLREWGSCGRVLLVDGEVVGHALWAPPVHVPGADGFATAPVSGDAVVLTEMYVAPEHRGGGLGRVLVQGMAKDLVRSGTVRAVEAFGHSGPSDHDTCTVPTQFLLAVGFRTHRAHPVHPRMRMDLKTTVSLRQELERGLDRLLAPVKRQPRPVRPVPRDGAQRGSRTRSTRPDLRF